MRPLRTEALLYFPAIIIGGMCTLGGLAWIYEKTRKKFVHPRLGPMTYYGDGWVVLLSRDGSAQPVRVELPGDRKTPSESDIVAFEALWARIDEVVEAIRPRAVEDLEDAHDAVIGTSEEADLKAAVERAAEGAATFAEDWVLSGIHQHKGREGQTFWCLIFEVSWDLEHQRVAYLEPDGRLRHYDLSCTVVNL